MRRPSIRRRMLKAGEAMRGTQKTRAFFGDPDSPPRTERGPSYGRHMRRPSIRRRMLKEGDACVARTEQRSSLLRGHRADQSVLDFLLNALQPLLGPGRPCTNSMTRLVFSSDALAASCSMPMRASPAWSVGCLLLCGLRLGANLRTC